jgi:hypothetical protein
MPRTRIFVPEGSATTPSPTRILRASGVADPAEGTLHTTPRAAKKIVLPSGAQASDTTGPFPDARVRTRRPEAGSAIAMVSCGSGPIMNAISRGPQVATGPAVSSAVLTNGAGSFPFCTTIRRS